MSTLAPPTVQRDPDALIREARRRARRRRAGYLVAAAAGAVVVAVFFYGGGGRTGLERHAGGHRPSSAKTLDRSTVATPARSAGFISNESFPDATHGFLLATSACSAVRCAYHVDATADGGRTWRLIARLPACQRCEGARTVRMVDGQVGYILGPRSYTTHDGGHQWISLTSPLIEALTSGGTPFALTYLHGGCPAACDVKVARLGIAPQTFSIESKAHFRSLGRGDTIVAGQDALYAMTYTNPATLAPSTGIDISRDAGRTWRTRPMPCRRERAKLAVRASQLAAGGRFVAVLCTSDDEQHASIEISHDRGRTFEARSFPRMTAPNELAVNSRGTIAVANGGVGGLGAFDYRLLVSRDGGRTWGVSLRRAASVPPSGRVSSLSFDGNRLRWITGPHTLWSSSNGGRTWTTAIAP